MVQTWADLESLRDKSQEYVGGVVADFLVAHAMQHSGPYLKFDLKGLGQEVLETLFASKGGPHARYHLASIQIAMNRPSLAVRALGEELMKLAGAEVMVNKLAGECATAISLNGHFDKPGAPSEPLEFVDSPMGRLVEEPETVAAVVRPGKPPVPGKAGPLSAQLSRSLGAFSDNVQNKADKMRRMSGKG